MKLKIDPEFQSLIPPLSPDEYKQLEANIIQDGCRDPLVHWKGTLIDGHNRYRICQEHKVPYGLSEMVFDGRDKVTEWIIMNQFGRRNLQAVDRVKLSLKLEDVIKEMARKRMLAGVKDPDQELGQGRTNQKLAEIAGVSDETIRKYKIIQRDADEEIKEAVNKGEKSITKGFQETKRAQLKSEPTKPTTVTCRICGKEKSVSEFYGTDKECRKCKRDRQVAGLTVAEYRKLDSSKDRELDEFYEKMKSPSAVTDEPKTLDTDPIITDLLNVLKPLRSELTRFAFIPEKEVDQETMEVVESIIRNITIIKSKLKEK